MAGILVRGIDSLKSGQTYDSAGRVIAAPTSSSYGDPASFSDAAKKQGNDYDTIMSSYKDLMNPTALAPMNYTPGQDVAPAMANLGELSRTGGYSGDDIANLRARGVSPIRSIYDSARQNLDRQRSLQGGYSPGYTSALTRMARDQSNIVSGRMTDVNAGISEAVARNRLSASSPYASMAAGLYTGDINRRLEATSGARGLYGTNPALTSVFGNQVAQAAQLGQGQQDINIRRLNAEMPMFRG